MQPWNATTNEDGDREAIESGKGSCTAPSRWLFIVFNPVALSRTAGRERTEPVGDPTHFLIGRKRFSAPPASSRTISAADKTSFTPSTDSPAKNDIASIVP